MRRRIGASLFLAAAFAGFHALGKAGQVGFGTLAGIWLAFFAVYGAGAFWLFGQRDRYGKQGAWTSWIRSKRIFHWFANLSEQRLRRLLWAVIFVCWLPAWFALFPGVYGYDAPIQMEQFFGYAQLTSHHPVAHTCLLGSVLACGKWLWGSYSAGLALFTFLQGLIVSHSLSCALVFVRKRGAAFPVVLLGLAVAAFHPVIQALSFNCTKDTLFGAFFLYFVLAFAEGLKEPRQAGWRLTLPGFLMCLFRNQGIYILLALLLGVLAAAVWARRDGRKSGLFRLACGLLVTFVLGQGIFFAFSHALHIPKGDKREMLSVPMQQAACIANRALSGEEVSLTEEELAAICEVIPQENLRAYLPVCADPVKEGFRTDVLTADLGRYVKIWLSVGMKNPGLYLAAFKELVYPYLDMTYNPQRSLCLENPFPELNYLGITRNSLLPAYQAWLYRAIAEYDYHAAPPLSGLLQPGLVLWLLVMVMSLGILDNDRERFWGMMPCVLYVGTLLLGPVALLRYLYPMLLCQPLFMGLIFKNEKITSKTIKKNRESRLTLPIEYDKMKI